MNRNPFPKPASQNADVLCTACGSKYIAKSGAGCPNCAKPTNPAGGEDIITKVLDNDSDLIK